MVEQVLPKHSMRVRFPSLAPIKKNQKLGSFSFLCYNYDMRKDYIINNKELMKEWDWEKNNSLGLFPDKLTCGSGKKVCWKCPVGHEYQATILHRASDERTNCPICYSGRQTSFAEQCIYYYVKKLYPDAINRYKASWLGKMELDIFIPSINYAIEYDGFAWHGKGNDLKRDLKKYDLCHCRNIKMIRIREKFALGVADYQFGDKKYLYKSNYLVNVIDQLLSFLNFKGFMHNININIDRDRAEIQNYMNFNTLKDSFLTKFPNIAKEWNYSKNGKLKPEMFKPYSDKKVWWICSKCGYEYESTIGHRAYGTGCPKCGIEKSKLPKCKKVLMKDIKTKEIINEFISISDAAREMKINASNISMACKGLRQQAGGYHCEYVDNKKD